MCKKCFQESRWQYAREYRNNPINALKQREYQRNYRKTQRGIYRDHKYNTSKKGRDTQERRRIKDKTKVEVRSALNHAIRDGKLVRLERCEFCNVECYTEAHHWCYSKQYSLDVVWLCKSCHCKLH